jgi:stress-induced morphogen
MPMTPAELEQYLRTAFPDGQIDITDLAGDNDHYSAKIVARACTGLSKVRQHQLVYAALKGKMGGELHALQLETLEPSEA